MKKKILYINPVRYDDPQEMAILNGVADAQTRLEYRSLGTGPEHLQYKSYRAAILMQLVSMIKQAENEGFDAVIVGCFLDPGLEEGREITANTLVVGPGEASILVAATLDNRFSILVTHKNAIPEMEARLNNRGPWDRLATFKSVEIGVLDLQQDKEATLRRFTRAAEEAIESNGAEVIILGCTGADGFYEQLQRDLGVPVIDPGIAAAKFAEFLVEIKTRFGWKHSKIGAYETPPEEEILRWQLEGASLWQ